MVRFRSLSECSIFAKGRFESASRQSAAVHSPRASTVDGGLVRVAVRTIEDGVHGKSIGGGNVLEDFVWREAGWVGLESGNVGQRLALHESVDAFTEIGAAKKDLAPQVLPRRKLLDPLDHEASGGGPSGHAWCDRTGRARRRLASLTLLGYPQSLDHYSTPILLLLPPFRLKPDSTQHSGRVPGYALPRAVMMW
jgi:hypothetical protein